MANDEQIMRLKAEIFDIQVEVSTLRRLLDQKLSELNKLETHKQGGTEDVNNTGVV